MTHLPARALLALVLAACAGSAYSSAGSLSPDPTGLWFDSAHSGWGLDVVQQGDTAFAVLFTYDTSHKPAWFVASNLVSGSADVFPQSPVMTGTLYRTTGPAFSSAAFDPHAVGVTPVGDLQISYGASAASTRQLSLSYSVDGVQVSKTLQAQTWSSSAQDLAGDYAGQFFLTGTSDSPAQCPAPGTILTAPTQPNTFSVGANNGRATISWSSDASVGCTMDGGYSRDGQIANLAGAFACATAPPASNPSTGDPMVVSDIVAGSAGISGAARLQHEISGGVCSYTGTFGGVLRQPASRSGMNPDPTGLWFSPQESGWGLILTQQGTNIFAALFSYGADGKATWWVAS
ncbi:MAG TPA: hypothetical protein VH040_06085, partial [Usitatibacter sp.]|nr:hypothetical protein [Usitatibacter sp.]